MQQLDIGKREGWTDYIDFIDVNEFDRIAAGIDKYGRTFVCIKCVDNEGNHYAQTFFQRYSHDNNLWMCADVRGAEPFLHTGGGMRKEEFEFIDALILEDIVYKGSFPERFLGKEKTEYIRV